MPLTPMMLGATPGEQKRLLEYGPPTLVALASLHPAVRSASMAQKALALGLAGAGASAASAVDQAANEQAKPQLPVNYFKTAAPAKPPPQSTPPVMAKPSQKQSPEISSPRQDTRPPKASANDFLQALSGLKRPEPTMPNTDRSGDLAQQMEVARQQEARMTGSGYVDQKNGLERFFDKAQPVIAFLQGRYDPDKKYKSAAGRQITEQQIRQGQAMATPTERVTASDAVAEADRKRQLESQLGMAEYARTGQMDPAVLEQLSFLRGNAERSANQSDALERMRTADELSRQPNPDVLRNELMARMPWLFNPQDVANATGAEIDPQVIQQLLQMELAPKRNQMDQVLELIQMMRGGGGMGGVDFGLPPANQ